MLMTTMGQFMALHAWQLVALGALILCSALVNVSETAVFSLSRGDLFHLSQDHRKVRRLVPALMRDPSNLLTTIMLSINLMQILYFVLSTLLIVQIEATVQGGHVWGPVTAAATFLAMVLLGEIMPKAAAFLAPAVLAPVVAPMLATAAGVVRPVHRVLMAVFIAPLARLLAPRRGGGADLTANELASLLALSQKRGLIGQDQTQLLQEVLELTDLKAGDVMVPRVDMVAYEASGSTAGLLELIRRRGLTKLPVYEGDLDHVVGVVHAKRLLAEPERSLRECLAPVQFVPQTARLERVLLQFRATGSQIGIVVDEYGGTAGLITLEAILEEIVGDIADVREAQRGPAVQQVGPAEWLVDGDLPAHEWAEAFPTDLRGARFATVGGFVVSLLGGVPKAGQTATYRNIVFTVEAVRRRRIALLRVGVREGT